MAVVRIALAQINPTVGDFDTNVALVTSALTAAADAGAQVAVYPELALSGYPIEDLALNQAFVRAAQEALDQVCVASSAEPDVTLVVGTIGRDDDGRARNEAVVIRAGVVLERYAKIELPTYGVFDEQRVFAPGDQPCVIEVAGARIGVVICEDLWEDGGPIAALAQASLDALVVLNGSPFEVGKAIRRMKVAARRAEQVGAPVAYVNMWGGQDELVFDGHSFVTDSQGTTLASAGGFEDALVLWDLPLGDDANAAQGDVAHWDTDDAQVYAACVCGLRDYVRKNSASRVALGLSGGIDSALVAAMATDALGASNVVAVSMPSAYSSQHSRDDAAELAQRVGLDYRVVPIEDMVEAFRTPMALTGIAEENLQARVRGVVLMGISNAEGPLVLAPGNKSELSVGYSTMYGDAVGAFAPLKDLYKSKVWDLARWRNAQAKRLGQTPPIPDNTITKPPSAELRPGQVDQDSLPPYEVLDALLEGYVERRASRAELLGQGFDADVVDTVIALVDRAEWKRRQYPPGPKVTPLALGRDRRLPITSRWREKVEP